MIQYQKKNLTLGDSSEELLSEDSGGLPFVCHYDESRLFTGHHIPWHWHDWIEINYIDKGSYQMHSPDSDLERMKFMLQYIYAHYSEPLGLEEIAGAAGISPRECTRCFQRSINRPPIRCLIEYRAQMAAMRLERTDDSISTIAEQCGFVSDSYFGKTFKDIYGCPPRDYRKKHRA